MKQRVKEALYINAEENSTNKEEDWNWTKLGSASCSMFFFVVFQKPLHALSLSYLLFPQLVS